MSAALPIPTLALALATGLVAARAHAQVVTLDTGNGPVRIAIDEAARLPADFPADVALPETHVLASVERSNDGTTLTLDVPGTASIVAADLATRMRARGWQPAAVTAPAGGHAQVWEKDTRAVLAWLMPAPAGTRLQVQLRPRR